MDIKSPERDMMDEKIEAMLDETVRKPCREITYNPGLSYEKDYAEADERLAAAQADTERKAEEAKNKVKS